MHSRRLLIGLTIALFSLQMSMVIFWRTLSTRELHSADAVLYAGAILGFGLLDFLSTRMLLRALRREELAYTTDVTQQLEQSLESYRGEAQRQEEAVREVGAAIQAELAQARQNLQAGAYEEADAHVRASIDLAAQTAPPYCDNIAVAAILENKAHQCVEAGVMLVPQVTLPTELPLPEMEVVSILFNLIDNALRECQALMAAGVVGEPCITVRAKIQAGQLFVEVTNPSRSKADIRRHAALRRLSTSQHHGWGTSIVTEFATRHHGLAEFKEHDGSFTASVMIPLPHQAG